MNNLSAFKLADLEALDRRTVIHDVVAERWGFDQYQFTGTRAQLIALGIANADTFPAEGRKWLTNKAHGCASYCCCTRLSDGRYRVRRGNYFWSDAHRVFSAAEAGAGRNWSSFEAERKALGVEGMTEAELRDDYRHRLVQAILAHQRRDSDNPA